MTRTVAGYTASRSVQNRYQAAATRHAYWKNQLDGHAERLAQKAETHRGVALERERARLGATPKATGTLERLSARAADLGERSKRAMTPAAADRYEAAARRARGAAVAEQLRHDVVEWKARAAAERGLRAVNASTARRARWRGRRRGTG